MAEDYSRNSNLYLNGSYPIIQSRPPTSQAKGGEYSWMLIIVSTVFRQLIQKVLLGLGPRIGFELVKATKVVEGIASKRKLIDLSKIL